MSPLEIVLARRTAGRVFCSLVRHPASDRAVAAADRVVREAGLRPLGDGWLEVSERDAEAIVTGILHRDLAYGAELMPLAEAQALASELLALVEPPMTCLTNGDWAEAFGDDFEPPDEVGFDPISDATLDAGVVCVGESATLLLWVADDD